jgi:hypothetical protein
MAIYIGLKLIESLDGSKVFEFFRSDGSRYGILRLDLATLECTLVESFDERCEEFAFPRACRALFKAASQGEIPDQLCYAA